MYVTTTLTKQPGLLVFEQFEQAEEQSGVVPGQVVLAADSNPKTFVFDVRATPPATMLPLETATE